MVTVAFGTTAPELSVIVPTIVASCADAPILSAATTTKTKAVILFVLPTQLATPLNQSFTACLLVLAFKSLKPFRFTSKTF
jgi:hypothetical protein